MSRRRSAQNPFPIIVPCHRVLAAGGKIGGFSAPGGVRTKLRLLSIEGAQPDGPMLFDRLPWAAATAGRADSGSRASTAGRTHVKTIYMSWSKDDKDEARAAITTAI